jgi:transposase
MERRTVKKRIEELCLPPRKNVSAYEADFRKAHSEGLSILELSEKFKISRSQVYVYKRKFGLSYIKEKKTSVVEPAIEPLQPVRSNKKDKTKECIRTK